MEILKTSPTKPAEMALKIWALPRLAGGSFCLFGVSGMCICEVLPAFGEVSGREACPQSLVNPPHVPVTAQHPDEGSLALKFSSFSACHAGPPSEWRSPGCLLSSALCQNTSSGNVCSFCHPGGSHREALRPPGLRNGWGWGLQLRAGIGAAPRGPLTGWGWDSVRGMGQCDYRRTGLWQEGRGQGGDSRDRNFAHNPVGWIPAPRALGQNPRLPQQCPSSLG